MAGNDRDHRRAWLHEVDAQFNRPSPDPDGVDLIPGDEGLAVMAVPSGVMPWEAVEEGTFVCGRPVEVRQ